MNIILLYVYGKDKDEIFKWLKAAGEESPPFFSAVGSAQKYLEQNLVDMVFLDIDDDYLNWTGLVGLIRLIDNATKIVLISDNAVEAVKAYDLGVFDFLLKPVTSKSMDRVILKAHHDIAVMDNDD